MTIYECKPGNLPEDMFEDVDYKVFLIGDTPEELEKEHKTIMTGTWVKRRNKTWCGHHPRYWRDATLFERRIYNRFMSNLKKS